MKLTFLGSGSAFTVGENYHSNMILETPNKKRLLIDCGSDARRALHELGLSHRDIQAVYISHLHADHCGGMEWLAFCTKYDPNLAKPVLFLHADLKEDLWNMLSISLNPLHKKEIDLSTYFEVQIIKNNAFEWEQIPFHTYATVHIQEGNKRMPCYGIQFDTRSKQIMITTDSQFTPDLLMPLYERCECIFQDCEVSQIKSGVHAHFNELKTLPLAIKQKMWLYHYQPTPLPDPLKEGFKGFVKKGQSFSF